MNGLIDIVETELKSVVGCSFCGFPRDDVALLQEIHKRETHAVVRNDEVVRDMEDRRNLPPNSIADRADQRTEIKHDLEPQNDGVEQSPRHQC